MLFSRFNYSMIAKRILFRHYRDMTNEDWQLVIKLKKIFNIN